MGMYHWLAQLPKPAAATAGAGSTVPAASAGNTSARQIPAALRFLRGVPLPSPKSGSTGTTGERGSTFSPYSLEVLRTPQRLRSIYLIL